MVMAKNNWKGFAIKAVIFLVIVVAFDFLVEKTYKKLELKALEHSPYGMVTEYTMWKVDADVIIMGASEAQHSYIPSLLENRLGMTVYNCGKDGCRFYYQNAMINGILDRYNPKLIIWSISPNFLSTPSEEDKGNLSQLNPFYKENEFCKQALSTKSKYEPVKLCSSSYSFNSRLFPYLFKIIMPDYQYEYGGYAPLFDSKSNLEIKDGTWNDNYDETIKEVFVKTLNRCRQSCVQIVCVLTPRYETDCLSDLVTYTRLKRVLEEQGIPFIEDFFHDQELMSPRYFKDNAHLNNDGARVFNKELSDVLIHNYSLGVNCEKN